MATDPTGRISHLPDFHRGVSWKQPCRAATTANITIATALNDADTLDGVTLAAGDRVLVKDQSTGSQNGIYVVGATPARAFDMDQDATTAVPAEEVLGAFVYVIDGTANGGKVFRAANTTAPTLGTTSITWTELLPYHATITLGPFYINDLPGTATTQAGLGYFDTATTVLQATNDVRMAQACHVVGLIVVADTPRTAGTATVRARINGSGTTFNSGAVVLDGTTTTSNSSIVGHASGLAVSAGQTVGADVVTSGWTPTTANLQVLVVVSID